jgi:hypothetical protein
MAKDRSRSSRNGELGGASPGYVRVAITGGRGISRHHGNIAATPHHRADCKRLSGRGEARARRSTPTTTLRMAHRSVHSPESRFFCPDPVGQPTLASVGKRLATNRERSVSDWKSHYPLLRGRQRVPDGVRNRFNLAAAFGIPRTHITDTDEGTRHIGRIWRAPVQRPRVPNQNITDLQWYWLHPNMTGFHGLKRFLPRHAVCTGRNFDRAILRRDPD